jgi:hypothetical protein
MCLMLVVVLLLMRQASRPELYERFFAALGAPLSPSPTANNGSAAVETTPEVDGSPGLTTKERDPGLQQRAAQWVAGLDAAGLHRVSRRLAQIRQWRRAGQASPLPPFDAPDAASADPTDVWQALQSFDDAGSATREALTQASDKLLLARVREAARFDDRDRDALYRALELVSNVSTSSAASIDSRALRAQPSAHRGQRVTINGLAVRAERVEARDNSYGVLSYWMVWLVTDDPTHEPLLIYAPHVPESIRRLDPLGTRGGPRVTVTGLFLRNQLYASTGGVELAPVIVGKLSSRESETPSAPTPAGTSYGKLYVGTALIGSLLGLALLYWLKRDGQSVRALRQSGLPTNLTIRDAADRSREESSL